MKRIFKGIVVGFCFLLISGCGMSEVSKNNSNDSTDKMTGSVEKENGPSIKPYLYVMKPKWEKQTVLYDETLMGDSTPFKPMEVVPNEEFMKITMKDDVEKFTSSLYEITDEEMKPDAIETVQNSTAVTIPDGDGKVYALEVNAEKGTQYFLLFTSSKQPIASIKASKPDIKVGEEIRFLVKNEGLTTLMYGSDFSIYQEKNGEWVDVSPYDAFTAIVYMMPPGEDFVEVTILQEPSLKAGKYKLVKKFGVENAENEKLTMEETFIIK